MRRSTPNPVNINLNAILLWIAIGVAWTGCDGNSGSEKAAAKVALLKELGRSIDDRAPAESTNTTVSAGEGTTAAEGHGIEPKAATRQPIQPDDPKRPWIEVSRLPRDLWEIQYAGNRAVGFVHRKAEVSRTQGSDVYRIELESRLQTVRKGIETEIRLNLWTFERNNGELLHIQGSYQVGEDKKTFEGSVTSDRLRFTITSKGASRSTDVPWRDEFRGPFAIEQSILRTPLRNKEIRELRYFDPLQAKVVDARLEAASPIYTSLLNGESQELLETRAISFFGEVGIESLYWTDPTGELLKTYTMSQDVKSFRCESDLARAVGSKADLAGFSSRNIPVFGAIEKLATESTLIYRIEHRSTDPMTLFSTHVNQRIRSLDARTIELTVFGSNDPSLSNSTADSDSASDSRYIANSYWAESTAPQITKMAELLLAVEKLGPSSSIESKVHAFQKGLFKRFPIVAFNKNIVPATEALRDREGDCVEHAVILTTLCRTQQIPSRVALGILYNGSSSRPVMQFHAWVEYHDGKRWISIDSTRESSNVPPDRIKVLELALDNANIYEPILSVFKATAELDITVLP